LSKYATEDFLNELRNVSDKEEDRFTDSVKALLVLQPSMAVYILVFTLYHEDERVRLGAVLQLGLVVERIGNPILALATFYKLAQIASTDSNIIIRRSAMWSLGLFCNQFLFRFFVNGSSDTDEEIRATSVDIMGRISRTTFSARIVSMLDDKSRLVRFGAISALQMLPNTDSSHSVVGLLKDDDALVRSSAAEALAIFKNKDVVDALAEALKDTDRNVRQRVVIALGSIGSEQVVAPLKLALNDSSTLVQEAASVALKKVLKNLVEDLNFTKWLCQHWLRQRARRTTPHRDARLPARGATPHLASPATEGTSRATAR